MTRSYALISLLSFGKLPLAEIVDCMGGSKLSVAGAVGWCLRFGWIKKKREGKSVFYEVA